MSYVDVIKHAFRVNYSRMIFLVFVIIFSLSLFVNSLYYSLSLLALVILIIIYLASQQLLSTLSVLMLCIVYIGAMMILIGYICAICPNVKVDSSNPLFVFFLLVPLFLFYEQKIFLVRTSVQSRLVDFFILILGFSFFYSSSYAFFFHSFIFFHFFSSLSTFSSFMIYLHFG